MIYICCFGDPDYLYSFIEVPDYIDSNFLFLTTYLKTHGKINDGNIINDCAKKVDIVSYFNYIYHTYVVYIKCNKDNESTDYLFCKLKSIPKDFLKYLILEWKKDPTIYPEIYKFEQELDSIYDNIMIKDIIE